MNDDDYEAELRLFPFPMTGEIFGDWHGIWRVRTRPVAMPIGEPCISCHEPIRDGEAGGLVYRKRVDATLLTVMNPGRGPEVHFDRDGGEVPAIVPIHRACLLLDVIGHLYGVCRCTQYDGMPSKREAAVELERRVRAAGGVSARDALDLVRGRSS